jgi:hypothetical protein
MAKDSIWFVTSGSRSYRFDLSGQLLEILEKLTSGDASQDQPRGDNSVGLRRGSTDWLIKSHVCERNSYVAVYGTNANHLACE